VQVSFFETASIGLFSRISAQSGTNLKLLGACIQKLQRQKRAVPAPTSEPLCKTKPFCARCTILHAVIHTKKSLYTMAQACEG